MLNFKYLYTVKCLIVGLCALVSAAGAPMRVRAASDAEQRLAQWRALPVQSNEIPGWPAGPTVGAESAILMDLETGAILYSKNILQQQYPASTTKILTTLLVAENCELDDIVTFSYDAVFDTPRDSSHIAMDVGQELTVDQCLQAMLIWSANEVCYACAEHITGTTDWSVFADMMNRRAEELGCLNSHFVNPNGLPDEDHYTTAYDLAMIGRAFFSNEMLCRITLTRRMEFPATDKLPQGKLEINNMQIIPGGTYAYEYLVGCKTGYTDDARSCLVSCAEKNGMKLICAVLHDESPYQYEDTIALFEYGFSNFEKVNVAQTETEYNIDNTGLFYSDNDIFGSSKPLLSLNKDDYIILPKTIAFEDTDSVISYDTDAENCAAVITYSYQGVALGNVKVDFSVDRSDSYVFDDFPAEQEEEEESPPVFINVAGILIILAVAAVVLPVMVLLRIIGKNYELPGRNRRRKRRSSNRVRRRRNRHNRRRRRRGHSGLTF